MKKGIFIVCILLVLAALAWFGGRKLLGSKDTDASSDSAEVLADTKEKDVSGGDAEAGDSAVAGEDASQQEETASSADAESADDAEDAAGEESLEDTMHAVAEAVEEAASSSDEGLLYSIKTSAGNNLGMVPIVNSNAVVMMDGGSGTTYQGEFAPQKEQEQSALQLKVEEQTALAAAEGKIGAGAFYRESLLQEFVFPAEVTTIEKFAFARSGLNSVEIPDGVTQIGYGAFYHCDALTDVTIPDSVTVIDENAFSHTPWLENWMAGAAENEEDEPDGEKAADTSGEGDFLIVGDGILLAYRGAEKEPTLPAEVKSIAPGALGD